MTGTRIHRISLAVVIVAISVACAIAATTARVASAAERTLRPNEQPTNNLRTSPPRMEIDVRPGVRRVEQLSVTNDSRNPQDVTITPSDFGASSDPRQIGETVEDGEFGAGDWITPELTNFRLAPFERIEIAITIDPPADAPIGTNLAALRIRSDAASGEIGATDNKKAILIDALVQMFFTVAGPVEHKLSISDFTTRDTYRFGSNRVVTWDVTFRNDGTVNEHVEGAVDVQSMFGNRAARIKIDSLLVLRGATRTQRVIWRDVPWVGAFTPTVTVRGDDARSHSRTGERTVILPWWVLPLIVALVIGPALWMWLARRRAWQRYVEAEAGDDDDLDDDFDAPWDPAVPHSR